MSKKIVCILLTFTLLFSLCACNKKDSTDTENLNQNQQSQETVIKEEVLKTEKVYEKILYEDNYSKVTLKDYTFNENDQENIFTLSLGVQNKSNGTVTIIADTESINGIQTASTYKQSAGDNIEKILTVNFVKTEQKQADFATIKSVEDIEKVTFKLNVQSTKNANSKETTIEFYPNEKEKNTYEVVVDEKTIVSNERCHISYTSFRIVGSKFHIVMYLENKTDKTMTFTFKNIFVGSEKIDETIEKTLDAGLSANTTIILDVSESSLKNAKNFTIQVSIPSEEPNTILTSEPITLPIYRS